MWGREVGGAGWRPGFGGRGALGREPQGMGLEGGDREGAGGAGGVRGGTPAVGWRAGPEGWWTPGVGWARGPGRTGLGWRRGRTQLVRGQAPKTHGAASCHCRL